MTEKCTICGVDNSERPVRKDSQTGVYVCMDCYYRYYYKEKLLYDHLTKEVIMKPQPIEQAPKDGSTVMLYFPGEDWFPGCWHVDRWYVYKLPSHGCGCCGDTNPEPTHFTILLPPQKEGD